MAEVMGEPAATVCDADTVAVQGDAVDAEVDVHGFGERLLIVAVVTPTPRMVMPFDSGNEEETPVMLRAVAVMDPVNVAGEAGVAATMVPEVKVCEMLTATLVQAAVQGLGDIAVMMVPDVRPVAVRAMPMASDPADRDVKVSVVPAMEPTKVAAPRATIVEPAVTLVPDRVWFTLRAPDVTAVTVRVVEAMAPVATAAGKPAGQNDPAGQLLHAEAPCAAYFPDAHATGTPVVPAQEKPGGQGVPAAVPQLTGQ